MNKPLLDMVSSADGSISFMRVACLLILCAVLFNWCYLTVATKQSHALDWQQVSLIVGALAAKAAQRPFESKPPTPPLT